MTNRERAEQQARALRVFYATGDHEALRIAVNLAPERLTESLWNNRYSARERAVSDDWERRLDKTRTRCYDEDDRELSESRQRGER